MIRLIFYGVVIYIFYRIIKKMLIGPMESSDRTTTSQVDEAELLKDPQCGTYFLKKTGVRARIDGQELFFCSKECRDAYVKERRGS